MQYAIDGMDGSALSNDDIRSFFAEHEFDQFVGHSQVRNYYFGLVRFIGIGECTIVLRDGERPENQTAYHLVFGILANL